MSNSTAQVLMRKGKRGAAAYIHADCASGSPQHLGPVLDVLLNPSKAIDEWETIDWCRWLLAGGRTPDEFAAVVRSYDKHDKCGLVWIPRVVAYRCRTCGISPCMSICRECFHRGDHSTHDFNMFLSQAGGACDCGDKSVMKEDGFCSSHGSEKCPRPGTAPAELMCVAEAMMPRLILRLLQHFRENSSYSSNGSQTKSDSYRKAVQECEGYVQMLMEFHNMGDLMRGAMTKALINPQMYRNLVEPPFPETEYGYYMRESHNMYEKAIENFPVPEPPDDYRHLPALAPRLTHNTLLDELIFWTFKYEFPQNVVCFLLNMLPDQNYKEHLTRTFVLHYARIPLVLEEAADPETLSNRVVHMSVQLFSNEALALRCVQQLHLLHVMVLSLRLMMGKILVQNTLHDPDQNFHYVIDCTRRVMKEHCYWPLVSDFNNVLSHKSVALLFLQDDALVDMWFEFLSMLQGMNVNIRETGGHIEFEPSSYYAAFSCELEAAAYPMWSVLSHLTSPAHAPLARRMLAAALNYLQDWLDAVHFTPSLPRTEVSHASFHFPLHRYLAAFLCCGTRCLGLRAADVLPPADLLSLLALHPLRVQSLFYEILAGVWVRNGLQIKGQAMTYIQANFCNSMVDMDIYWLQVCAAHLPADHFLDMCIDMFGVREWLSMLPMRATQAAEQDAMVEGLLTFLAILVSSRTNLGNDELTQSQLEVSTLLAAGDKTHSQLLELMPERSGNAHTRNFEQVLKELSTYRPPPRGSENLEQGLFVPQPVVWERYYDPLHVLRRAVHRRDFHVSMERYTAFMREKQKESGASTSSSSNNNSSSPSTLWPPLRLSAAPPGGAGDPRAICSSGVLHAAIVAVLHRGVHRRGDTHAPHAPPDHVLALAVYLLRVACDIHEETIANDKTSMCVATRGADGGEAGAGAGVPLLRGLRGDVCSNARTLLSHAPRPRPPARDPPPQDKHPAHRDPAAEDSDTEWEQSESESFRMPSLTKSASLPSSTTSTALAVPPPLQLARTDSTPDDQSDNGGDTPQIRALEAAISDSQALALRLEAVNSFDAEMSLALAVDLPTPPAPIDYDMDGVEWSVSVRSASPASAEVEPAPAPAPSTSTQEYFSNWQGITEAPTSPGSLVAVGAATPSTSNQMQVRSGGEDSFPVNESIISLLLKLHSQLSGRLDAFSLDEPAPSPEQGGDGPYYIGDVLRKLAALDERCAEAIAHVRTTLWPHQRERQAEQKARERREKEERSRRARERQQQVMREFARKQQQFMSAMESMEPGAPMEWDEEEAERSYTCAICNTCAPSAPHDPQGLVVLLQSTSVLAHRPRADTRNTGEAGSAGGDGRLALCEASRARLAARRERAAGAHHYRAHEQLQANFGPDAPPQAMSLGQEGGVHVNSCGHHLHLRCLHSYLRTLHGGAARAVPGVERGEYLCPVCRQLANAALPLAPRARLPRQLPAQPPQLSIRDMLQRDHPAPEPSKLSEAMGKAMEDMTACAGGKLKQRYGSSPGAIFAFVASLVRTNLECELVQRGGTLLTVAAHRYKPRNECIVPLMVVAGAHTRVLCSASDNLATVGALETWDQLHPPAAPSPAGPASLPVPAPPSADASKPVPLMLKDPSALLMQFLLLAPPHPPYLDMQEFTCIVQSLYALNYYQIVCQFCASATAEGRAALAAVSAPAASAEPAGLRSAARLLLSALAGSDLFTEDGPPSDNTENPNLQHMEKQLQTLLLPFLRISALLRHHLYGVELPDIQTPRQEFVRLAYYLELVTEGMDWSSWSAGRALAPWAASAARGWARQLGAAAARSQLAVRRLLVSLHVEWAQPSLLGLPRDYDRLFTYYHERVCLQCGAVPKEASVCLLCGTLVCLKQPCCRTHHVAEAVQHAMECGGGTGIFLVVTSTYIIVIRGRRACLWGSLYLDDYDEEDRDLKRGKPLYLSQDRLQLLQDQWLAHRFDHTKRTWVWHRDSL